MELIKLGLHKSSEDIRTQYLHKLHITRYCCYCATLLYSTNTFLLPQPHLECVGPGTGRVHRPHPRHLLRQDHCRYTQEGGGELISDFTLLQTACSAHI